MRTEDRYDSLFRFYADQYGVDWLLLKSQVKAESGFDPDAKSRVGACGLAQFMQSTWAEWRDATAGIQEEPPFSQLVDPRDPEDAIRAQAAYMAWLLRRLGGNLSQAVAAYNWGIGRMRQIRYDSDWIGKLPDETKNYIERIERYYAEYSNEK